VAASRTSCYSTNRPPRWIPSRRRKLSTHHRASRRTYTIAIVTHQHAASGARLELHGLHVSRPPGGVSATPRKCSPSRHSNRPRSTSQGGSDGLRQHTSQEFEAELESVRQRIPRWGGTWRSSGVGRKGVAGGRPANLPSGSSSGTRRRSMELEIDHLCLEILARRQPVAMTCGSLTSALKAGHRSGADRRSGCQHRGAGGGARRRNHR